MARPNLQTSAGVKILGRPLVQLPSKFGEGPQNVKTEGPNGPWKCWLIFNTRCIIKDVRKNNGPWNWWLISTPANLCALGREKEGGTEEIIGYHRIQMGIWTFFLFSFSFFFNAWKEISCSRRSKSNCTQYPQTRKNETVCLLIQIFIVHGCFVSIALKKYWKPHLSKCMCNCELLKQNNKTNLCCLNAYYFVNYTTHLLCKLQLIHNSRCPYCEIRATYFFSVNNNSKRFSCRVKKISIICKSKQLDRPVKMTNKKECKMTSH